MSEALPEAMRNRGIMSFISGEQGNTSLKLKEQGSKCNFGEEGT